MEYIFGTYKNGKILKVKSNFKPQLNGFCQVVREYPDQIITDDFNIVEQINEKKDAEGNYYVWYKIDQHYRTIDKTEPIIKKVNGVSENMEDSLCEQDRKINERVAILEDAFCELDKLGGK